MSQHGDTELERADEQRPGDVAVQVTATEDTLLQAVQAVQAGLPATRLDAIFQATSDGSIAGRSALPSGRTAR